MLNRISQSWTYASDVQRFFAVYAAAMLLTLFVGIAAEWYFLAAVPAVLLLIFLTVVDFRAVFFLMLACIPLSTELVLPNGFGTDVPSEPLMIGLMLVGILYAIRYGRTLQSNFIQHPITLLLFVHLAWIAFSTFTSSELIISVKFLLAKIWYVAAFFFVAGLMLKTPRDFKLFFWVIFIPLLFTVVTTVIRHAAFGFSFKDVYQVLHPFYRNHVAYASIIVVFMPYVWFLRLEYNKGSWKRNAIFWSLPILLLAVQMSYTRAAYVALFIAIGAYFIIRLRWTKWILLLAALGTVLGLTFMATQNRYLEYAPNFETTVSHQDFNNLITATYEMEDISTMERLYRWVAGFQMSIEKPLVGFGPGNFYTFYKSYTVTSFQTYVSDNPDQSGIHSYYLMTMVEQGVPGLLLFVLLLAYALLHGEQLYHQTPQASDKRMVMAVLLSLIVIAALLLINDLIETDKIGSFFFLALALLVNLDIKHRMAHEAGD
ncbi:MAG TPA: O-antigen ligase family protein [Saprospiraceae bacterium]|nr:O-antigen ligase family protein [Saprospiraceae bacterium]HMQ81552.1 O-antigen ligase family protein [Saprospiraceae bacterium]